MRERLRLFCWNGVRLQDAVVSQTRVTNVDASWRLSEVPRLGHGGEIDAVGGWLYDRRRLKVGVAIVGGVEY